jgi:hypothetical protein
MPRACRQFRHRKTAPLVKSICRIPWQTVAAGGAAVSGVIFAYKVADGIQQGTVEAARTSPETFIRKETDIVENMKAVVLVAIIFTVGFGGWRLARNRKPPA